MRGLVLFLALVLAGPIAAAEKRVALVIGVGGYQSAPQLGNPLNDAADVAAGLAAARFELVEAYDPTYAQLQTAIRDFGRKLEGADVGLVYYAGHGVQIDGRNYLLPVDATLADEAAAARERVDVAQILALLNADRRVSLLFLDACRDNPLAASLARRAGAARSAAVSQGLAQLIATAPDTYIAYSTQPGAVAADGVGRNSPFTAALLRHFDAPGLDIQELMRRVRTSVIDATGGVQVPFENTSMTQGFQFFALPPGKSTPSMEAWVPPRRDPSPKQIDIAMWNDVKGGSIEEIESYLKTFPTGVFAETAKARIAALRRAATADRDKAKMMAADIAKEFAALAGRGAIVEDPKTPTDFYANARLYELRGDFVNARRSYLGFIRFGLPYVDPHYRFQSFLRVQEGRAGAREVYGELAGARAGDDIFAYALTLLQETDPRKERLEAIIKARPEFAPAYYELARNYSLAQLGQQTQADQTRERELLSRFVELADKGRFLGWFIDQQVAAEQLEDARKRLAALSKTVAAVPISLVSTRRNSGWTIYVNVAEQVQEVFVAWPGRERHSLGFTGSIDNRTGRPLAKSFFDLPPTAAAMSIEATYRDASGALRGPFRLPFDPDAALVKGIRDTLETTTTSWLAFRDYDGRRMIYFTHLIGSRCGIREIRYGIDTMTPTRTYPLPACDKRDPNTIPDGPIWIDVPMTTQFASVQLTYPDGTKSRIERFEAR
jgi:hypothetical protein